MRECRKRMIFILKRFLEPGAISGTKNFSFELIKELSNSIEPVIISGGLNAGSYKGYSAIGNITVIGIAKKPFFVFAGLRCRSNTIKTVVLCSGFTSKTLLALYLFALKLFVGKKDLVLFQLVEFNRGSETLLRVAVSKMVYSAKLKSKIPGKFVRPGIPKIEIVRKKIRIGFFGQFHDYKGYKELLEAFNETILPDTELIFVGTNSKQKGGFEYLTARANDDVKVVGYASNYLEFIDSCDVVVFPFTASYSVLGVSLTLLEAMALGKTVIVSTASVLYPVSHNESGIVIDNLTELPSALRMVCGNKKLRARLGKRAKQTAKKFNIKNSANSFLKALEAEKW